MTPNKSWPQIRIDPEYKLTANSNLARIHISSRTRPQKNNHDIGFKWNGKEYELVTDLMFWDQKYSVNKFLNQVNQRYAFNLITKVSEEQSFQYVEAENQQDGSIRLLLRKFK